MTNTCILKLNGQDVVVRKLDYDFEKVDGVFQDSLDIISGNLNAEKILRLGSEGISRTMIVFKSRAEVLAKMIAESLLTKDHSDKELIEKATDIISICKKNDYCKGFVKEWLNFNGIAFVQRVVLG